MSRGDQARHGDTGIARLFPRALLEKLRNNVRYRTQVPGPQARRSHSGRLKSSIRFIALACNNVLLANHIDQLLPGTAHATQAIERVPEAACQNDLRERRGAFLRCYVLRLPGSPSRTGGCKSLHIHFIAPRHMGRTAG